MRMTSEEPRPIDSFCPEPGPREWGARAAAAGIKMFPPPGGGGAGREAGPFTPGPAPRETAPKKGGRSLFKPYERPTKDRYTGASLLTPMNIKERAERRPAGARGAGRRLRALARPGPAEGPSVPAPWPPWKTIGLVRGEPPEGAVFSLAVAARGDENARFLAPQFRGSLRRGRFL